MKTAIIILIFVILWFLSVRSWGIEVGWDKEVDLTYSGITSQLDDDWKLEKLILQIQSKEYWSVPIDQECLKKFEKEIDLVQALACAEWDKIKYSKEK